MYVIATYDLKVGEEDELMESATIQNPLTFYSGLGMMLPEFEDKMLSLNENDEFDFTITAENAYGLYDDEAVIDLPKSVFEVDGKVDEDVLFEGNIVPLMDNEGNRVEASIVTVGTDTVTVDLNHPLAGENLHFIGKLIGKREASDDEIKNVLAQSCGGSCSGCNGGCGEGHEHGEGGCCGNGEHKHGEGCCGGKDHEHGEGCCSGEGKKKGDHCDNSHGKSGNCDGSHKGKGKNCKN